MGITIAALVIPAVGYYVVSRWRWPYGQCRRCGGGGKNWGSNRLRWGLCRKCGGAGWRVR